MTSSPSPPREIASTPRPVSKNARRKATLALFAVVVTLVLLEALLQIGSLVVFFASRKPVIEVAGATDTILCVGDSWTHGMGCSDASKHSYPAVLQELLRQQTGKSWTVVNGGQSGQNSRDVLLRLPSQLEASKPKYVLVLIGRNDLWSRPDLVDDGTTYEDYQSYRFRWRLPRLLAWAIGAIRGEAPAASPSRGPRGPEWEPRTIPWPTAYPKEASIAAYVPGVNKITDAGWRALGEKNYEGSIASFRSALAVSPNEPSIRSALVNALARSGRTAESQVHLDWLWTKWKETKNYWVGRGLVSALDAVNQHAEAKAVAIEFLAKWPEEATVRTTLGWAQLQLGELAEANESALTAQKTWKGPYTYMVRSKVEVFSKRFEDAILSCLECFTVTNDARALQDDLSGTIEGKPELVPVVRRLARGFSCDADVRERMVESADDCIAALDGKAQEAVLTQHWAKIMAQSAKHGAVPVFLTYPIATPYGRRNVAFAREHNAACIDVETTFAEKIGAQRIHAMRSSDGHVNDEGYRLMAEHVLDGLKRLPDWK